MSISSMLNLRHIVLTGIAIAMPMSARCEEQASSAERWKFVQSTDAITDLHAGATSVRSEDGKATLIFACDKTSKDNPFTVQVEAPQFLGGSNGNVATRFDKGTPDDGVWEYSGRRAYLYSDLKVWSFVRRMVSSQSVFVRAYTYSGGIVDMHFDLSGAKPAVDRVLAACDRPKFLRVF